MWNLSYAWLERKRHSSAPECIEICILSRHSLTLFTFPFQKCFHPKVRRQRMHTWLSFTEILIAFASRYRRCFEFRPSNRKDPSLHTNTINRIRTDTTIINQEQNKNWFIWALRLPLDIYRWMWNIRFEFIEFCISTSLDDCEHLGMHKTFLTFLRNENVTHHTPCEATINRYVLRY